MGDVKKITKNTAAFRQFHSKMISDLGVLKFEFRPQTNLLALSATSSTVKYQPTLFVDVNLTRKALGTVPSDQDELCKEVATKHPDGPVVAHRIEMLDKMCQTDDIPWAPLAPCAAVQGIKEQVDQTQHSDKDAQRDTVVKNQKSTRSNHKMTGNVSPARETPDPNSVYNLRRPFLTKKLSPYDIPDELFKMTVNIAEVLRRNAAAQKLDQAKSQTDLNKCSVHEVRSSLLDSAESVQVPIVQVNGVDEATFCGGGADTTKSVLTTDSDWDNDVVKAGAPHSNPFAQAKEEEQANGLERSDMSPELLMKNFIQRVQSRTAIPEYALTDAVFAVDKPFQAMSLDEKLPIMELPPQCKEGAILKIVISEVYSPFQFWFNFLGRNYDEDPLTELNYQLISEYSHSQRHSVWQLSDFFIKPGYMCVLSCDGTWRRARILSSPLQGSVHVYLVDYGTVTEVRRSDLWFLKRCFAKQPPLAARGTLSHVQQLGLHWPPESTAAFTAMVKSHQLYALITDIDAEERSVTMKLSFNDQMKPTLNNQLIQAKWAATTVNFGKLSRAEHCGRRMRYLRERLPTFGMLESHAYPTLGEIASYAREGYDFEDAFDDIIYSPDFYADFKPPEISNPFCSMLQAALAAWLTKFKAEEQHWLKVYRAERRRRKQEHREKQKSNV